MSVMLLDETKAGNLIQGICQMNQMWDCGNFLDHTNKGELNHNAISKFVRKLYQANLTTWNKKYEEKDTILDIIPTTGTPFSKYQTLKTLQCLHYNIELEYIPTAKKLLDQVEIMTREIMGNIVESLKEYDTADWG